MVVAGAMDPISLQVANILVGNPRGEACLELTFLGPKLEFTADAVIALTGADMAPKLNGDRIEGWRRIWVPAGSVLEMGGARNGCRTYLAVAGGFDLPQVMGSAATYLRGQIGGLHGRALMQDDLLPLRYREIPVDPVLPWFFAQPVYPQTATIRIVRGPQAAMFTEEGMSALFGGEYEVTPTSDRMGYRLQGAPVSHRAGSDIISDGIAFGAVQVPADGMPIILLADRQTTGGYAKVGTVISLDLSAVAQSKPGDRLRFAEVSVEEAQNLYLEMERILESLAASVRRYGHCTRTSPQ